MTAINDFLRWAELDRNRSQHTLTRYRAVLRQIENPEDATREQVEAWWATRYHLSAATRANELACLKAFYSYCTRFDVRPDDPTRRLSLPKVPNQLPRMIGKADFEALLGPLTVDDLDLRRAFALGGHGGHRISEAAALDWKNVDLENRRIYVRGKGLKERAVPINGTLFDLILPEKKGNVVTAGGEPYSAAALQRKVNRFMRRHQIDHTFHDLRKRGASIMLSKGANPVAVKTIFGWSSMDTVSHYAVVGDSELDRAMALLE